jgi:hypothetical protein
MIRIQFCSAILCRLVFHFTLLFVFFLSSNSVANPNRISPDQTLIIGGNKAFAPYEYLNSEGLPAGHNIDLIKAVAEKEGLNIKIILEPWHTTRRLLEDKKIDAVTGMMYSKERDKIFDFSVPYLVSLHQSGEYDEIYLKWFSVNKYKKHTSKITKYVLLVFSVFILLLLTVLCWNWLLNRAVRHKTKELYQNEGRLCQIVENIPIPAYVVDENRMVTQLESSLRVIDR